MKVAYTEEGDKLYIKNESQDFHFKQGTIKQSDLSKGDVKTNTGVNVAVFDASFIDKFENVEKEIVQSDLVLTSLLYYD